MEWVSKLIERFEADSSLDEVLVNGTRALVEVRGKAYRYPSVVFQNAVELEYSMHEFAFRQGVRLDCKKPSAGGYYCVNEDLYRWHFVLRQVCPGGPLISWRRHRFSNLALSDFGGLSGERYRQLCDAMGQSRPVFVCGRTGAGKTSFLAGLLKEWCSQERVAIVESVAELPPLSVNWINLVSSFPSTDGDGGFSLTEVFNDILRLRPDRVVVGELRSHEEGKVCLQVLTASNCGFMTSLHVESEEMIKPRLRVLLGKDPEKVLDGVNPLFVLLGRGAPPQVVSVV